jgi:ABC-2 type transport system permease protein/sodium transport system permease protein
VAQVFGLLLLFAAFFSAVLLIVTSFARSFKEAQAYVIPLTVVSLLPGLLALLPGLHLSSGLALVPLLNIVLLARDVLEGTGERAAAAIVVLVTLGYAVASLVVAGRIFGAESVLYTKGSSWFGRLRRRRAQ